MLLYDYQRDAALFASRAGRSIIGDDMGLGKTIEAIGAAEIMARHFGVERVLVICPTSLKHQWEREISRVIDRPAQVIGGFRRSREAGFRAESFCKVTNSDTVYRDLDLIAARRLPTPPGVPSDPLAGLLRTGLELLGQLGSAASSGRVAEAGPPPVVERIHGALQSLLESFKA